MKKAKTSEVINAPISPHSFETICEKDSNTQIDLLKKERKILPDLGNDITKVREKKDLIILFSKRLKGLFYFSHTLVTLIDQKSQTYFPFLFDH